MMNSRRRCFRSTSNIIITTLPATKNFGKLLKHVSRKYFSSGVFQEELAKTDFSIFRNYRDLGYFGWNPKGKYRKVSLSSAADISSMIDIHALPGRLIDLNTIDMPIRFQKPRPQSYTNKFPYDLPHIASLHVISRHRNYDLSNLDFAFGGSALNRLATQTIPKRSTFVVCRVPGTNIVIAKNHKIYRCDLTLPSFQFERLVTGNRMEGRHSRSFVEHLQVMEVGNFRVLFSAEVDAFDPADQTAVEVKLLKPQNWGTKVLFQMISSGSAKMCYGTTKVGHNHHMITRIDLVPLSDLNEKYSRDKLESNILRHMSRLKELIEEYKCGCVLALSFDSNNELQLTQPSSDIDLIPSARVVSELIQ